MHLNLIINKMLNFKFRFRFSLPLSSSYKSHCRIKFESLLDQSILKWAPPSFSFLSSLLTSPLLLSIECKINILCIWVVYLVFLFISAIFLIRKQDLESPQILLVSNLSCGLWFGILNTNIFKLSMCHISQYIMDIHTVSGAVPVVHLLDLPIGFLLFL